MRTSTLVCSLGTLLLLAAACSGGSIDQIQLPPAGAGTSGTTTGGTGGATMGGTGGATMGGTGGTTGGTGGTTGGVGGTGGSVTAGASGAPPMSGGVGGSTGGAAGAGGAAGVGTGGMAGSDVPMGGMAGTEPSSGGMAGTGASPMGGMAGTGAEGGSGGSVSEGPYAPRTGSFKVLAYSKTSGFRHDSAIVAGTSMLMAMGTKQGFEVTFSEDPGVFSAQNLEQYEVVFGLDPTGNNLSNGQKTAFEEWMTTKDGAFAGVHSSTDHENGWAFYAEVTGQYYDLHDVCCSQQNIQWDPGATNHPTVVGLPSPWSRSEEWYKFNQNAQWSTKPGFQVLSRVTTSGGGTRPVSFVREWGNFRSFYTSLGHEAPTYSDANFIKHVSAGIMWSARREALIKP